MKVDVRVVCATNRSLWDGVMQGTFRKDLYYRIACFTIRMPPLRERLEDLPLLAEEILRRRDHSQTGAVSPTLSPSALDLLRTYTYPGNVRELSNVLHVAATATDRGYIDASDVHRAVAQFVEWTNLAEVAHEDDPSGPTDPAAPTPNPDAERRYIRELLHRYHGHRRHVAEALGMSERTLYRRLKQYKLE